MYREKWRVRAEEAARRLSGTRAVASTRLFPESTVVHVVAVDGWVAGRVRRERGRWVAVCAGQAIAVADTFAAAVYRVAEQAGSRR
ncbi:hypothetical protein [Amycolatopsis sp. A1MSW2902]|uniref:hypothetical protein n=1 Tax=Amycolatopsis sp. A1MSW2902 TaxID=687413 RepID=UPI00307ED72D